MDNIRIDMHMHTTASDGTWTVEELLEKIIEKDIRVFAVTDHDILTSSQMMQQLVPDDREFHLGVEISCTLRGKEYHILAYDFDPEHPSIKEILDYNISQRVGFNKRLIQLIVDSGRLDHMDDFQDYTFDGKRGGWKSLNYLIDKGVIQDMKGFFALAIESGYTMCFRSPIDVIEAIKTAGGYAILAHPSAYVKGGVLGMDALMAWKGYGISGIECYSPYLEKLEDAQYYVDFCKNNKLMVSAGSDCHGDFSGRILGEPKVCIDQVSLDFINIEEK